jgi:hypothetical protein
MYATVRPTNNNDYASGGVLLWDTEGLKNKEIVAERVKKYKNIRWV